jgi:uncharacterized integral membrane protein
MKQLKTSGVNLFGFPIPVIVGGAMILGGIALAIVTMVQIGRSQREDKRGRDIGR